MPRYGPPSGRAPDVAKKSTGGTSACSNLYSITKGPQAIRDFAHAMRDMTGNLPPIPGVFPDYSAPMVRNVEEGARELTMAQWGMPSPVFALKGRNSDSGVTNIRNVASPTVLELSN
jgi:putative SOS response-associated peptidase YedK